MFPRRPERLRHFDYRGPWRYSLTFCAAHKHDAFITADIVDRLIEHLLRSCQEEGFEPIAYCFMPDHLHLLVEGLKSNSQLKPFCRVARQRLAHEYAHTVGRRLWQPGFFDRVLREEETTDACALYIFHNPVRGKLTATIFDYPFNGGSWFDRLLAEHSIVRRTRCRS